MHEREGNHYTPGEAGSVTASRNDSSFSHEFQILKSYSLLQLWLIGRVREEIFNRTCISEGFKLVE